LQFAINHHIIPNQNTTGFQSSIPVQPPLFTIYFSTDGETFVIAPWVFRYSGKFNPDDVLWLDNKTKHRILLSLIMIAELSLKKF